MGLLEKILSKPVPAPVKLPDNGGSFLPPQNLDNTVILTTPNSCLIKISLIKGVRDGDYKQVIATLESIKKTEIDAETLIPWALNKVGYEIEEITFTTRLKEMKNLAGGMMLNEEQLASFRKMEFSELGDVTKLFKIGEIGDISDKESDELIKLSSELAGKEWQLINYQGAVSKGIKAVIVIKKKIPEVDSGNLVNNSYLQAPASWN